MNNNSLSGIPAKRCTLIIGNKGFFYNSEKRRGIFIIMEMSVCLNFQHIHMSHSLCSVLRYCKV